MSARQDWDRINWLRLRTPWDREIAHLAGALGLHALTAEQRKALIVFASSVATHEWAKAEELQTKWPRPVKGGE